jgi:sialic acid synthase SpsE
MEPGEFKGLVKWIRTIDHNLDQTGFKRSESEKVNKFKFRRSYHYVSDLREGTLLDAGKLVFLRPGDGIDQNDLQKVLGKPINRSVKAYDACTLEHFNLK